MTIRRLRRLNVVLGAVGARGGIVGRSKRTEPYISADVAIPFCACGADGLQRALGLCCRRRTPRSSASPHGMEDRARADWLLPAPGFLEELTDVPTPADVRDRNLCCGSSTDEGDA